MCVVCNSWFLTPICHSFMSFRSEFSSTLMAILISSSCVYTILDAYSFFFVQCDVFLLHRIGAVMVENCVMYCGVFGVLIVCGTFTSFMCTPLAYQIASLLHLIPAWPTFSHIFHTLGPDPFWAIIVFCFSLLTMVSHPQTCNTWFAPCLGTALPPSCHSI